MYVLFPPVVVRSCDNGQFLCDVGGSDVQRNSCVGAFSVKLDADSTEYLCVQSLLFVYVVHVTFRVFVSIVRVQSEWLGFSRSSILLQTEGLQLQSLLSAAD